ncbi:MAG: hypothetical protein JW738_08105 [Actinobacteria bacterium]|nr:hypothetical protein [Actinomycetota bacterium]
MKYSIRQAEANDLSALARLVYIAGQDHLNESIYNVLFPGPMEHKLETIENLLASWSWFHFTTFLVAESEGGVIACISGYSMSERGGPGLKDALTETGWSPRDSWEVIARMAPLLRVEPEHSGNAWVIEHTAALEEINDKDLLKVLIQAMIDRGKENNCSVVEFTFFTGDEDSQEITENLGFKVGTRTADGAFKKNYGSPGMTMMTLPL